MKKINTQLKKTEVETITETIVNKFINEKVLLETNNFCETGILNKFKNNYALFKGTNVKRAFTIEDVIKITGKNKHTNLIETITKCGTNKNSWCVKSEKTDIHGKHKKLGGPYESKGQAVKRLKQVEHFKNVKEDIDPLIKEKLLHKFFKINEEIVNPDNIGKLKPQKSNPRAKRRDKLGRSASNKAKPIKGPPGRMDTPEEAKFRYATYIELRSEGKKPKSKT